MITNGYCTVEELQGQIDSSGESSFTASDRDIMEIAIESASRWIDEVTGTRYFAQNETRYYTADWADLVYIDDCLQVTSLRTDSDGDGVYETNWTSIDYVLEPINAIVKKRPYRQIRTRIEGDYLFPTTVFNGIEVVGKFGYSENAPLAVKQASLLIAHRLWRRKDSILGVSGTPGLGVSYIVGAIQSDSDVVALLQSLDVRMI